MGVGPQLFNNLKLLRDKEAAVSGDIAKAAIEQRTTEAALAMLRRSGGKPADIKALETKLTGIVKKKADLGVQIGKVRGDLRDAVVLLPQPGPDTEIPNTRADTPVLMLPVRLETRYFKGGNELRVRIYPDQAHIDAHEPELTGDEIAAGTFYWTQRWQAATAAADNDAGRSAFQLLAQRFRPRRAAWIVLTMRPKNWGPSPRASNPDFPQPAQRAEVWTRAAFATLLPNRWTVVGMDANGRELFRKTASPVPERLNTGPDPSDTGVVPMDAAGIATELPIDAGMKWLANYDAALAAGMAVTLKAGDVNGFNLASGTIPRLVVFGVNTTLTREQTATRLEALLNAHCYGDGLSLLRPGTPTNNGSEAAAGFDSADAAVTAVVDPLSDRPPAGPGVASLARALGIDAAAAGLASCEGRDVDPDLASHMVNAVWSATLGQTLDQLLDPQMTDANVAAVRNHAVRFLRPGGPLPTIRIGRQPYGILPVVAHNQTKPIDKFEGQIGDVLHKIRGMWSKAATKAPRLDKPGTMMAQNMEELLQQGPMAAANRFRRANGPKLLANTNVERKLARKQEAVRAVVFAALGVKPNVKLASLTLDPHNHRLGAAFTQAVISDEAARLQPDYLTAIANEAASNAGRDALLRRGNAASLLEALTATAVLYEFDAAASLILWRYQVQRGVIAKIPDRAALRVEEFIGIEPVDLPKVPRGQQPALAISTPHQQAALVLPDRTGSKTLGDYVVDQMRTRGPDADATAVLRGTLTSLRALADRPAAEVDRLFRGVIDAYSYRLDPWLTSVATRRLAHWRSQPTSRGISIGGFGWVDGLKPDNRPDSEGYIHAPSLHHAQTAAVLRSGHLSHRDAPNSALNIDLSSRRVRLAQGLLEGVAQGQPLAALLGYRLERRLREKDVLLAKFILPLRRLFPLRPPQDQVVLGNQEAIAARDVVDGIKLLDKWRAGPKDRPGVWLNGLAGSPNADQITQINELAVELDDMFDAVSDLLVAEGVHQLVGGNPERASAALGAMDRQMRPIEPDVLRTPRTGRAFAQRLGVMLIVEKAGVGWPADVRGNAEPRVNAWVAGLIGTPDQIGFTASVEVPGQAPRALTPLRTKDLGLSPMSLLMMTAPGGNGRPSELQEYLAIAFAKQVKPAEHIADAALVLSGDAAQGSKIGLAAFEALMERVRAVTGRHRPMTALDIAPPGTEADPGSDTDVLYKRGDVVIAAQTAALAALNKAMKAADPNETAVHAALLNLARTGVNGAMPGVLEEAVPGETPDGRAARRRPLLDQAAQVAARVADQLTKAAKLALRPDKESKIDHATTRLQLLLGKDFPVVPPFTMPEPLRQELFASLRSRDALIGKNGAVLHGWLARMGEVKPRSGDLALCLMAAETLTGSTADLRVAQFPHGSNNRWIGLPFTKATPEQVDLSLCLHAPGVNPDKPPPIFAGFMCDDWTEVIPAAEETTGIAFHYDAPASRPPQAMLLAVHPGDNAAAGWTPNQLLATINEAWDQTRMRAVRPQDLDMVGAVLPLVYLPANYQRDVAGVDFTRIKANAEAMLAVHLRGVRGKA